MGIPQAEWKRSSTPGEAGRPAIWIVADVDPARVPAFTDQLQAIEHALSARGTRLTVVTASARTRTLPFDRPFEAALQLGLWLLADHAQVVHFHFVAARSPLVAAARLAGAHVIVSEHAPLLSDEATARARLRNALVDVRVAASRRIAETVAQEHVEAADLVVIEEGISLSRVRGAQARAQKLALGCVGQPLIACIAERADRGLEAALEALPLIGRQAVCAIAAPPEAKEAVARLVRVRGLERCVRLRPLDGELVHLCAAADVVVAPSEGAASGLQLVEALALGRPVVVPERSLHADRADGCGVLVPPRDAGALAGGITRLLDDPLLAERLGRAARARAEARHALGRFTDDTLHQYRRFVPALEEVQAA